MFKIGAQFPRLDIKTKKKENVKCFTENFYIDCKLK